MSLGFFDPAPPTQKFRKGFDDQPEYQMVPLGETRTILLQSFLNEPGDVFVFVNDRSKAVIQSFFGTFGPPPIAKGDGFVLSPNSAALITIEGIAPGRTKIVAEGLIGGGRRRTCRLSIKPRHTLTYQLGIVSDGIHVPDFNLCSQNLIRNMLGAEKIWLGQANIELKRLGVVNDVRVNWDLKDPIVIDDPIVMSLIAFSSLTKDLTQAQLYIYGTWDLIYHDNPNVAGSNFANLCFVENAATGAFGEMLCAHEVGHALGLPHLPITDSSFLMHPFFSDVRLLAAHIEFTNPL